jgi:hypothetical protein
MTRPTAIAIASRFTALVAIGAVAAGCSVQAQEAAPVEEVGETASAISVESYDRTLGWHGGTGGSYNDYGQACGAGNVVVGIQADVRDYSAPYSFVYRLALICATLEHDGTLSPSWTLAPTPGTLPGTHTATSICPSGTIAVGLDGQSATYVDGLNLECMSPADVARGVAPGVFSWTPPYSSSPPTAYLGGAGGNSFVDRCPAHYAITYAMTRHGNWLDAIQAHCQYIAP